MPNAELNESVSTTKSSVRPRQVLLVGLGGVGSRTVDRILSEMPEEYKPYTKAIALDTDLEELDKMLHFIPSSNRIALGSNPDNGQTVTVGEYIRNHPETMDWFVKGEHLETIKKRNTAQGAKQIRMVSRIALAATNDFLGMKEQLAGILHSLNPSDGTTLSRGLLVMVVCSIAGGTGAGTVLQFPLYLEQALSQIFSDEDIQMECSMLLPNIFSRVQDIENQLAARANAYAVVRELMSLNSGRIKRGDILPNTDFESKADNISPYGRVLFFDDVSMAGDSLEGDVDHVYIPKIADALNQYLFGPVSGKITSALDNTLARIYRTEGASIFSSVGTARLEFPRATYLQYATGKWVTKAISETWTHPGIKAKKRYQDKRKQAMENGQPKPSEWDERAFFCEVVDGENGAFYKEIKRPYYSIIDKKNVDAASEFWKMCETYLFSKLKNDSKINSINRIFEQKLRAKGEQSSINESLQELEKNIAIIIPTGVQYAMDIMSPLEAKGNAFYYQEQDTKYLFTFLKKKKLHPIMLRYFLYQLYNKAKDAAEKNPNPVVDYDTMAKTRSFNDRKDLSVTAQATLMTSARTKLLAAFAKRMLTDLEEYILEIEDMFKSLEEVLRVFEEKKNRSLADLPGIDSEAGTVLAGGQLSMMYTWKQIEEQIGMGEDIYTVDDDLNLQLHELIYRNFIKQVSNDSAASDALKGLKKIRVRTKYEKIIAEELQKYYARLLNTNYTMCFPQNVIEAALLECGLRNAFRDEKSRVDSTERYSFEDFIQRNSGPLNFPFGTEIPNGQEGDAAYLNALLSAAISKSKPFCGRIDDLGGDAPVTNRLVVVNQNLLRTREDTRHVDENGVAGTRFIENELIDGVSTSRVGDTNINSKFVADGASTDEIICVTSLAGMQPFNFVAFLPPDDDEHAATKAKTYYTAYRDLIDKIAVKSNCITPHLHRNWHLADQLEDVTPDHTDTYNRNAAEAFLYGFIFDVIRVGEDGIVEIGKQNDSHFVALENSGLKAFNLLDPTIHASINNTAEEFLTPAEVDQKRGVLNSILVKIFELLATGTPIRNAIISYAEDMMTEIKIQKNADFIHNCLNSENISNVSYSCILDVIDGYYQGTRQMPYGEKDRSDTNVGYMFTFLLQKTFDMCEMFSSELSSVKELYYGMVESYYQQAVCDDSAAAAIQNTLVPTTAQDQKSVVDLLIRKATSRQGNSGSKPFSDNGRYSLKNAKDMIEIFLKH